MALRRGISISEGRRRRRPICKSRWAKRRSGARRGAARSEPVFLSFSLSVCLSVCLSVALLWPLGCLVFLWLARVQGGSVKLRRRRVPKADAKSRGEPDEVGAGGSAKEQTATAMARQRSKAEQRRDSRGSPSTGWRGKKTAGEGRALTGWLAGGLAGGRAGRRKRRATLAA